MPVVVQHVPVLCSGPLVVHRLHAKRNQRAGRCVSKASNGFPTGSCSGPHGFWWSLFYGRAFCMWHRMGRNGFQISPWYGLQKVDDIGLLLMICVSHFLPCFTGIPILTNSVYYRDRRQILIRGHHFFGSATSRRVCPKPSALSQVARSVSWDKFLGNSKYVDDQLTQQVQFVSPISHHNKP